MSWDQSLVVNEVVFRKLIFGQRAIGLSADSEQWSLPKAIMSKFQMHSQIMKDLWLSLLLHLLHQNATTSFQKLQFIPATLYMETSERCNTMIWQHFGVNFRQHFIKKKSHSHSCIKAIPFFSKLIKQNKNIWTKWDGPSVPHFSLKWHIGEIRFYLALKTCQVIIYF